MVESWGYPKQNTRVLTPEETEQAEQWLDEQQAQPTGPLMVEIKRGLFVQPSSVLAIEVYDQHTVRVFTRASTFNVPGDLHTVLDRLDCQTHPLPSPADGQED